MGIDAVDSFKLKTRAYTLERWVFYVSHIMNTRLSGRELSWKLECNVKTIYKYRKMLEKTNIPEWVGKVA